MVSLKATLLLLATFLVITQTQADPEITGNHTFTSGFTISWTVDGNSIHFNVSNTRNCWSAFGINIFGPFMDSADVYAISNIGGVPTVSDYMNLGYAPPTPDTNMGCSNDVEDWSGSIGAQTWYSFTRQIDTGDSCDYAIKTGANTVVWAFGYPGMTTFDYHEQRGSTNIDFLAGTK